MNYPFSKPRKAPKKRTDREYRDKRVYKADKSELRRLAYERAGGRCENIKPLYSVSLGRKVGEARCNLYAPLDGHLTARGHLAHKRHGIHRSDTLDDVLWKCAECHMEGDHGSKCTYPRRPGKVMTVAKAKAYWTGRACFCEASKPSGVSFCADCLAKLPAALQHDLGKLKGKDWLNCVAECETDLQLAKIEGK